MSPRSKSKGAPETEQRRCAVYTRKSTSAGLEQEFNSLDAQREACVAYVERQPGWTVLSEHFDDGGFTGANTDRPAFSRIMADIEAGKIDVLVVYKVDRLSRSLLDFVKVMERLNALGVAFVSVTQNFTTADAMGRLTMNLLASFAEFEREMIAERTRDKIAMSRRKGKWTGGGVPFGYDAKEKRLAVNELEAAIVREAFALMLQYRQTALVRQTLNERGLLPRGKRLAPGKKVLWTTATVGGMLRNPIYAGVITYGDEQFPGEHAPLIDDDTFQQVQEILKGKVRPLTFRGTNHEYLLRGLVRCGLCKAAMSPASTTQRRVYRYYRCATRDKHGAKVCPAAPLPAVALEEYVVERIAEAALDGALAREVEASLAARLEARREHFTLLKSKLPAAVGVHGANAERYVDELTRLHGKARQLVESRLEAETQRLAAAERQLAGAERALAQLDSVAQEFRHVVRSLRDFRAVWEAMTVPNRGRLCRALLDHVEIDEASGQIQIHLLDFAIDPELENGTSPTPEAAE